MEHGEVNPFRTVSYPPMDAISVEALLRSTKLVITQLELLAEPMLFGFLATNYLELVVGSLFCNRKRKRGGPFRTDLTLSGYNHLELV